ncbi:unnamed protein product [Meloidogyne enterolobii]|uniref:Uncharacterized protein n=1 Tax=Meloidogyne enterolobii TaxID=390850 RepID=A0ACB0YLI1_MELEN
MSCKIVNFVEIKNKWSEINNFWKCCSNKCINTNKPIGKCIEGNGYANLINDENIKYFVEKGGKLLVILKHTDQRWAKIFVLFRFS